MILREGERERKEKKKEVEREREQQEKLLSENIHLFVWWNKFWGDCEGDFSDNKSYSVPFGWRERVKKEKE